MVDAKPRDQKLPTEAYYALEEVHDVRHLVLCACIVAVDCTVLSHRTER